MGSNQRFRQGSRRIYRRSSCYVKVKFHRDWACYPQCEVGLIFAKHGIRELDGGCTKASCFGLLILRPNEAAEKLDFFPASQLGLHSHRLWSFGLLERSRGRDALEYRISQVGRVLTLW